jgi:hypothetical protein
MLVFRATAMDCGWRRFGVLGVAGLLSGFAIVSYPPMALPVGVSLLVAVRYFASARKRLFGASRLVLFWLQCQS